MNVCAPFGVLPPLHCISSLVALDFLKYHQGVVYSQNGMYHSLDLLLVPLPTAKLERALAAKN